MITKKVSQDEFDKLSSTVSNNERSLLALTEEVNKLTVTVRALSDRLEELAEVLNTNKEE